MSEIKALIFLRSFLGRRPRIVNFLHRFRLAAPMSQTNEMELRALAKHSEGASSAVEIGSFQGKSAAIIAANLAQGGRLYCVDPWPEDSAEGNPVYDIFRRHLRRTAMDSRVKVLRMYCSEAVESLPDRIDFAFIDGDHSWDGISTDWSIISPRIPEGGIICLHDTAIPTAEPWRVFDSCRFFDEVIAKDERFEMIDTVYSLRTVRRRSLR